MNVYSTEEWLEHQIKSDLVDVFVSFSFITSYKVLYQILLAFDSVTTL